MNKQNLAADQLYTCTNRDSGDQKSAGYFIPIFVADVNQTGQKYTYGGGLCF